MKRKILSVIHYGDILTDFSRKRKVVLLLPHLSLINNFSYMTLQFIPAKNDIIREFIDCSTSYPDVKYVEELKMPGLPPTVYVIKKNYGVLKAILKTAAILNGVIKVRYGYKLFPVVMSEESKASLKRYVRVFSPRYIETRVSISSEDSEFRSIPSITPYEFLILREAIDGGYFDWPKKVRLEEIADKFNISKATAAQHLRKALKKIIIAYMSELHSQTSMLNIDDRDGDSPI